MQGKIIKIQHKNKGKSYGLIRAGQGLFYFRLGEAVFSEGDPVIFERNENEEGNIVHSVRHLDDNTAN